MNLETRIKPVLWDAIVSSYRAENYTHAIKDAMAVITVVLREKSGVDGDGQALVGQALGFSRGRPPKIKINKLQTDTERNIQQGLQDILRGMYGLIRNPRSHEIFNDPKESADAIILFINYLLDILEESQQAYTIQGFLDLVEDSHFVDDNEYAKELVEKIPIKKQADTVIALYHEKEWSKSDNFRLVIRTLLDKLNKNEIEDFLGVVSEELQSVQAGYEVSLIIKILPSHLWPRLDKIPRLRAENMLISLLSKAYCHPEQKGSSEPACTWISSIAEYFLRKDKLRGKILENLKKEDFNYHNFIAKYMFHALPDVFETEPQIQQCCKAISECIIRGNQYIKDKLVSSIQVPFSSSPSSPLADEKWRSKFVKNLEGLTDTESPELYLYDGTPFLGKFKPASNPVTPITEEEIPF